MNLKNFQSFDKLEPTWIPLGSPLAPLGSPRISSDPLGNSLKLISKTKQ